MNEMLDLLSRLRKLDIHLELDDDKLKINAPKGALNDELKSTLKEKKQEIINFLAQLDKSIKQDNNPIVKVSEKELEAGIPATDSQARFWFLDKFSPDSASFNIPAAVEIRGKLDVSLLEQSIQYLISRHDSLRTAFEERDGKPYLKIHKKIEWQLEKYDVDASQADTKEALDNIIYSEAKEVLSKGFNLSNAPLLRIRLLEIKNYKDTQDNRNHYVLLNCIHHIVCDGWSVDIILREMTSVYLSLSQKQAVALSPLEINFSDYAFWQSQSKQKELDKSLLNYWQEQLKGALGLLPFPYDRPRPIKPSISGSSYNFSLDIVLSQQVDIFCKRLALTPFMFFIGAYQITLSKYSGASDISVGIPIAGRTRQEIEGIIGLFLNALIIRSKPQNEKTLVGYFEEIKRDTLGAFDKQALALDTLIDSLEIDREHDEVPGVQFGFILQNAQDRGAYASLSNKNLSGFENEVLSIKPMSYQSQTSKHDLCLSVGELGEQYFASIEYKNTLLDLKSIEEFSAHYIRVVQQIIQSADEDSIANINLIKQSQLCEDLSINKSKVETVAPLTRSQEGFYFNDLVRGENQSTLIGTSILVKGDFDLKRWEKSLQELSDKRAVLRMQIYAGNKKLHAAAYQVIFKQQPIDFSVLEYKEDGSQYSLEEAQTLAKTIIYTPFDLHKHSLIRHRVIKLEHKQFLIVTSMHHVLMDAVSAMQHWVEAQRLYQQYEIAPDNYLSYLGFTHKKIDSAKVIEHWQSHLNNVDAPDYSVHGSINNRSAHEHGERKLKRLLIEGDAWKEVRHYCRKQGITPAILYKVMFGYVVNMYCQPDNDFYINEIITGRSSEFATTIANCFLIQPFIFKGENFKGDSSVLSALSHAKQQQKENRNFALLSQQAFNKLQTKGRVSFFYNYLTFIPPEDFLGNSVGFRDWGNEIDEAVEFNPRLGLDGLELNLFYREGLFREVGLLENIQHLIKQLIDGAQNFSEIVLLNPFENGAYLKTEALPQQKYFPQGSANVVELILTQAKKNPNSPAIITKESTLSYKDLLESSAKVAAYLLSNNIGNGSLVVIEQEKSPLALVSILAVLRVGAQYLPLDISLPEDRKGYIKQNSHAALVLSDSNLGEALACEIPFEDKALIQNSPAYTIYTSGSTGVPKGVQINHDALLRTYLAWEESFALSDKDKHLQMASLGFDVFTGDWVRALCSGASLFLVDKKTLINPELLCEIISHYEITIAEFVPAVLRTVLQVKQEQAEKIIMRMLLVGSDAWFESDQALLEECVVDECVLINSYGSTEAVIDSSFSVISKEQRLKYSANKSKGTSIGVPFANTALYVLNENQKLLPKEVAGELYIAGPDLAEAYVSDGKVDEAKTSAAFLTNTIEPGFGKMYRTGDRAKLCNNNALVLLGRIGQQIKVRGFRVELGEIENKISALNEVDECVVLAQDNKQSQQINLIAYIVFHQGFELSTSEIRQQLSKHLPDYMLPQLCMSLESIPLNSNGKLDRKSLPEPDFSTSIIQAYVAPRNTIEETLVEIWQHILGIEKVGVEDNFFELGGHSLLATQLASRIRAKFDRELTIKAVFELPTIALLAQEVSSLLSKDLSLNAPDIVSVERQALMPVSYAQQRFWFLDRLVPGFFAYNMPFGLKLKGDFKPEIFQQVLTEILRRHELLRCHFISADDKVMASVEKEKEFSLSIENISGESAERQDILVKQLIEENAHRPFVLDKDILIRCSVVKTAEKEHLILGCMHHIISDGWSVRVLFAEIALLYNAFSLGRPSPLPELSLQYLDYAHWEQNWLQGEVLERYTQFWINELSGAPEILKLPTDKPRPQVQTFSGKQIALKQPLTFQQKLERFAKSQNVSLFMVLMSAMAVLMSRYTKEKDILIGTPVAGRNSLKTENIIGLFLNAVIVRSRLQDNPSVSELLNQVKESSLAAFAHQEMPAEILYERVANHRNPQYPAGAQVGLVLQNTANQQTELNAKQFGDHLQGLSAELLGTEQVVSNYDFGFTLIEQSDGLLIVAEFNTDLFFDSTIERMLDQYLLILETMMSDPSIAVENIDLVPQEHLLSALSLDKEVFEDALPLSAMQHSMYLANRLNPYSKEYGVGFSVRIRQALGVDLWTQSLQGLIDTQSVARIIFKESSVPYLDEVYQVVLKNKKAKVDLIDWSNLVEGQKKTEQEIEALASQFINVPYNVLKDDLMRVMLIKVSEDYYVGVFGAHHILMDGIAVVAFGVMGALNYQIVQGGGQAIVHEDKYKMYLLENKLQMDSSEIRAYWKTQLQNPQIPLEALEYPVNSAVLFDLQNPPQKSKKSLSLESHHWEAIKLFCKQQRITPALYFKALYALVLARYCRTQESFYIFEILAGRPVGHMNALGCYFQQIPIVIDKENISANALIGDLFKALRQSQKQSKHKHLISVPLQTSLLPNAPVSFMYNFEHYIPDFHFMGQAVEIQEYSNQVNGIVQFLVKTLPDTVQLNLQSQEYFFNDFDLLQRVESLSQDIISGIDNISKLELLRADEKNQQLTEWNNSQVPLKTISCIHESIEQSALLFPSRIAASDHYGQLSYKDLNEEANQLANFLISQDVGVGDVVGICLPLCKEVPLTMLAVLKTGAAYLPMDSRYPDERLQYFIEDSQPKFILSNETLIKRLSGIESVKGCSNFYSINSEQHKTFTKHNIGIKLNPDNLLYVLYTSGSTGLPNCTGTYHRCEFNLLQWYCTAFNMNERDKLLIISALGFDLTQKNLMAPLTVGAQSVFYDNDFYDNVEIRTLIDKEKITWMNCAPSAFYPLISDDENDKALQSLRWVFLGGEAIAFDRLSSWYPRSACHLVNSYGPSECTDISSFHILEKDKHYVNVPIGRANDNVLLYILDNNRNLLPVGLPGELYVGGAGVGAQYLNNPELSAEKFFDNPFAEGLIYKTGDLVNYLPDGNINYIGRTDFQIKVRGVRIEPAEIERKIKQVAGVQDCLVLLDTQQRLIAYVLSEQFAKDTSSLIDLLELELRNSLSAAMLPSHFVVLEEFPLSPNGKIDRKALPEPTEKTLVYIAPESDSEIKLAAIWKEILGIEKVSRYDNFFEIGGHSLLAVQLVSSINKGFNLDVPLAILFEAQTLDLLAIKLDNFSLSEWKNLVAIQAHGKRQLFCIHPLGGEVLCYRDLSRALGDEFSVFGIQASGLIDGQEIINDLNVFIQHYADEIEKASDSKSMYLAGQSIGGVFSILLAQELERRGKKVEHIFLYDSFLPTQRNLELIGIQHLRSALGAFMKVDDGQLQAMSELEQLQNLFDQAKAAYLIPQDISFSQIKNRYLLAQANIVLAQAVKLPKTINTPILHIEAKESLSGLNSSEGWDVYAKDIQFLKNAGNHESILHAANVKNIADQMLKQITHRGR